MKSFKTLAAVVIALVLINIILMGILWYNNDHKRRPVQGNAFQYLSKELQLNSAQIKRYDTLRKQHFDFTSRVSNEQRTLRDSFFNHLKDRSTNQIQINDLEKRILIKQAQLDSATFYHFRSFRAILNTGQQEKFDKLISQVLHIMGQPRQHPGDKTPMGPPPGDGRQPEGPPPSDGPPN